MAVTRTEDLSKSTGAYPSATQSTQLLEDGTDFSRSTHAYPMDPEPVRSFVDSDVDYSASTGAYPMYDDEETARSRTVALDALVEVQVATPGPVSTGDPDVVALQRADLGLTDDPSGESDAGYEARPSTIPGKGFDGVERPATDALAAATAEADSTTKSGSEDSQSKTIAPPPAKTPRRRTTADS